MCRREGTNSHFVSQPAHMLISKVFSLLSPSACPQKLHGFRPVLLVGADLIFEPTRFFLETMLQLSSHYSQVIILWKPHKYCKCCVSERQKEHIS